MAFRVIQGSQSGTASFAPDPPLASPTPGKRQITKLQQPAVPPQDSPAGISLNQPFDQPASDPSRSGASAGDPESTGSPSEGRHPLSSPASQGDATATIERLQLELEAARDEVEALHQMLEDLPEIFERKFRERQRAFLDHHEHLLADNRALRDRLYALTPATPPAPASLPPAQSRRPGRLTRSILSWFGRDAADPSS
jgi:hypothetical protein